MTILLKDEIQPAAMSQFVEPLPSLPAEATGPRCVIIGAAERLFREIGYRKTTVADIAKALRMSPANVYRFFESKKEINEAVAERIISEMEAELSLIVNRPGVPAAERLRDFIVTHNRLSTERFTAERRMHEMVEVAIAESWQVVHRHIEAIDAMLSQLVTEGVRSGEFEAEDPLVTARCVHSATIRFCHPGLIVQCADEPGPELGQMVDFLLRGLRSGAPAAA